LNYPVWQTDFPHSLIIAFVAVLHVFVSHFAIGGGAFLVLTERRAYQTHDDALLGFVKRHSKFFILLTLVFGAVSGVGIWFAIGLVSPEATSSLIHTFLWGWAIESVLFFVEVAAALIYVYHWDRHDRATHLAQMGIDREPVEVVVERALAAQAAGIDGVIASGQEAGPIRAATGAGFSIVCPGIRPGGPVG